MALTRREAFIRQARSDFAIFERLQMQRPVLAECHPLHYLQMASEKLAKAIHDALGVTTDPFSHIAFSHLPYQLARADIARAIGVRNLRAYRRFLHRAAPIFRSIDELCPAVGAQILGGGLSRGPNVEYPWPARDADGNETWMVPAEYSFGLATQLQRSGDAARVLQLIRTLLDRFETVFSQR